LLYKRVLIPEKVWDEITPAGKERIGTSEVLRAGWLEVCAVADRSQVRILETELDSGEAEAIVLASELKADLLLIDERRGRIWAEQLGLNIIGVLGILAEAKQIGLISDFKQVLDALIMKSGFRVSRKLYNRAIEFAGESNN
jgi:uncharacterized protein